MTKGKFKQNGNEAVKKENKIYRFKLEKPYTLEVHQEPDGALQLFLDDEKQDTGHMFDINPKKRLKEIIYYAIPLADPNDRSDMLSAVEFNGKETNFALFHLDKKIRRNHDDPLFSYVLEGDKDGNPIYEKNEEEGEDIDDMDLQGDPHFDKKSFEEKDEGDHDIHDYHPAIEYKLLLKKLRSLIQPLTGTASPEEQEIVKTITDCIDTVVPPNKNKPAALAP